MCKASLIFYFLSYFHILLSEIILGYGKGKYEEVIDEKTNKVVKFTY